MMVSSSLNFSFIKITGVKLVFFYISSHDYLLLDIQLSVHIWVRSFIQILCLRYQIWVRKILICLHERTHLQFFPDQKAKLRKFLSNFIWYVEPFWDSTRRLRQTQGSGNTEGIKSIKNIRTRKQGECLGNAIYKHTATTVNHSLHLLLALATQISPPNN